MSFISAVRASFGATQRASAEDGWLTRAVGGGKTSAGNYVSETSAMTFSAWWACLRILSETLAHTPLIVFERTGKDKVEPAQDLEIYWALKNEFNEHMSSFVARETAMGHLCGWGNAYLEVQRTKGQEPVALWPMLPDRTAPEMRDGKLTYYTTVDGKRVRVSRQNCVHVPGFGFDGYKGYSPIQMARNIVGLGHATEEFGAKYFAQGSKSGGILMHPGTLSNTAKGNIRDSHENDNAGLQNSHRITILEEGMRFIATTIPPDDAQFLETRKFQVVEVARFFRMPLHKLQEMDSATFSNIEQQAIEFVTDTMLPYVVKWEQELNRKLWVNKEQRKRYFVKFNLRNLLRGDSDNRAKFYKGAIETGWMTRNEARLLEDMEPLEGLDEPLVPLNMGGATGDKLPNEKALAILEAARMVGAGEPGAISALSRLVKNGEQEIGREHN